MYVTGESAAMQLVRFLSESLQGEINRFFDVLRYRDEV